MENVKKGRSTKNVGVDIYLTNIWMKGHNVNVYIRCFL